MSHNRTSRVRSLLSRLLHVPLRLKVMAGVMAVTLVALAAFDLGAVTTTRRYLLAQTDSNLHLALTLTEPRLRALLPEGVVAPGNTPALSPALFGNFEIAFVPWHGPVVILEQGATAVGVTSYVIAQPGEVRSVARPGLHMGMLGCPGTVRGAPESDMAPCGVLFRILSARVNGGFLVVGTSLYQVTQTTGQVEAIVTLGSIAVVLLIGLGVFVVVRRGLRPVEAMARQADRITGGDLTGRVAAHNPRSEVGRLGAALNGMLARIEASQQQMRRFFGDASHELRTPLASLRANAQLYQQGALQRPGEVDEVMDRIVLETRRMGRLIDDMLGLARLGQQPCRSREPVDLTAVVTGCAERARVADPARTWQARIAGGLTVTGDEELLRRAVDNLLMNVIAHTPAGTAGAITASAAGGRVTIEVTDDGPGVPPDHLPHIFERFYRAGPLSGGPGSGSGLGLAIVAEIVSAHGGTTRAAPVGPHGLRVTLALPARPDPRPAPRSSGT
jgi:two-component system, OmpR family, sensor kinase